MGCNIVHYNHVGLMMLIHAILTPVLLFLLIKPSTFPNTPCWWSFLQCLVITAKVMKFVNYCSTAQAFVLNSF